MNTPIDSRNADPVVSNRADGSGNVSSMSVVVQRIAGVRRCVKTMGPGRAIDAHSVDGCRIGCWVGPHVRLQVLVVVINARIDHCNHDI